jgi:hypothetical protein
MEELDHGRTARWFKPSPSEVVTRNFEGILDMLDRCRSRRFAIIYHDVEAAGAVLDTVKRKILGGQTDEPLPFAAIHGVYRSAIGLATTRFHLDKDQGLSRLRNQIQLTRDGSLVSLEDPEPFLPQVALG